ncbi:MAG: serine hydrolase domain-containing protein [Bacteroidota bacterium]|nr:serine hydrolase domain-containing protein [Bacteroidota bacterium]
MKKSICLFFVFVFLGSYSREQSRFITEKPEKEGLSSEWSDLIKPLMQQYIDQHKLPGLITMVARHGKIVEFSKYGMMGPDKTMQFNTIFRIASMTKPITTVAVMMLYEEGRIRLDDPVSKYIPEFKDLKVFSSTGKDGIHVEKAIRPMTISDLLSHTSGLSGGWGDSPVDSMYRAANLSDGTLKDMIKKLSGIPLLYQPGTRWNYSRSTDVLSYLVEVVSGMPLDQFFRNRIFIPLKMEDTEYYVPTEKLKRVAEVYCPDDSTGIKMIKPDTGDITKPVKFISGNGGLYSTASDYMIFAQMLLNQGEYKGVRILQPNTVKLMATNRISEDMKPQDDFFGPLLAGMGFGYGFAIVKDPAKSVIHASKGSLWWSGTANTYFVIDPKEDMILILMTQFVPNFYYPVFREFGERVYQALRK